MAVAAEIRPAAAQNAIMAAVYPKRAGRARGRTDALPSDFDVLLLRLFRSGGGGAAADQLGGLAVADERGELGGGQQVGLDQRRLGMARAGDVDRLLHVVVEAAAQLLHDLGVRGR